MKITKEDLKQIIKEELDSFLAEGSGGCPDRNDKNQAEEMARQAIKAMNQAGDPFEEMEIGEKLCIRNMKRVGQGQVKVQFNNGVIVQVAGELR
mgnify:CR=1 FL=1|tara:strand:+ start:168 stop:449 length:282 start_codon:yes stop_codon:yes gene_type:complete